MTMMIGSDPIVLFSQAHDALIARYDSRISGQKNKKTRHGLEMLDKWRYSSGIRLVIALAGDYNFTIVR